MKVRVITTRVDGETEILGVIANSALSSFNVARFLLEKNLITKSDVDTLEFKVNVEFECIGSTQIKVELCDGNRILLDAKLSELE